MKVLLVDDNALFLEGLQNMLAANDIEVVGTAASGRAALLEVEKCCPEVILMDVQMPDGDGIETTRQLKEQFPAITIVILTVSHDDTHLFEAIKAGASGYLTKGLSKDRFLELLAGMAKGEPPFAPGLAAKILNEFVRREREWAHKENLTEKKLLLSSRQRQILSLVAQGLTYKEVGDRTQLSEATIKYHMGEITARLHLENRSQVIAYARELDSPRS